MRRPGLAGTNNELMIRHCSPASVNTGVLTRVGEGSRLKLADCSRRATGLAAMAPVTQRAAWMFFHSPVPSRGPAIPDLHQSEVVPFPVVDPGS